MDKKNQPDLVLFLITLVLLIIGLIMVLSASSYEAMLDYDDALHFFKRQAAFMALGFIPMFIMMNINIDFVWCFVNSVYAAALHAHRLR